ncbi:unnamed protein product [Ectocarpus sp. CCAP 1310/34]|nr:unnamed protein product [Ectocarpus sp. CCAP 1310/34]CAB1099142.1 unnamed protein product [Ectocarpus sp. CCAP 1310/34]CAB1114854.1 unnamed protein product [Ectocarpus sp. CCAP 1310/34]
MVVEHELLQLVRATLPAEYDLGDVEMHRSAQKKYRVGLKARHSSQPLLQWYSSTITTKCARGRNRDAESRALGSINRETWLDLAGKTSQRAAVQTPPPRVIPAVRSACPAPGSLREPGAGGAERLRSAGCGGAREGSGRPKGALGKAARRERAVQLREELVNAFPDALNLSPGKLQETLQAWKEFEPEWSEEAMKKYLKKGTYSKSQARKKIKLARDAELKATAGKAAAYEFRAESMDYFSSLLKNATNAISRAAEQEDVSASADLSSYQLAHVVQVAMTLTHLYTLQNDDVARDDAINIAARVARRSVKTVNGWERDFISLGGIKTPERGCVDRKFLPELDEGVKEKVHQWMLVNCGILSGEANKTAEDFRKFVNEEIMPQLEGLATEDFNPFKGLRVQLEEQEAKDGKPPEPPKRVISLSTATTWLKKLGCEYHGGKNGLYFDGHDDPETINYRNNEFLPELWKVRDHMEVWISVTNEEAVDWDIDVHQVPEADRLPDSSGVWVCVDDLEQALADLPEDLQARVQSKKKYPDGKRALLLYQDESIFRANDDQKYAWYRREQRVVTKKSPGQGIMVSGTIIHNVGFFSASPAQIDQANRNRKMRCRESAAAARRGENVKEEKYRAIDMLHVDEDGNSWSYHLFEYGKNKEGYWTGLKMLDHMNDVLDMVGVLYPEYKPVCLFDWTSCHDCLEVGAPRVSGMNVGFGQMRNGEELAPMDAVTILEECPGFKVGDTQHLVFQRGDDPPFYAQHLRPAEYVGKLKGMRQILFERGLLRAGMTKTGGKGEKNDPILSMEHVLGEQKDFKQVESSLVLLLRRQGGVCMMLPKYHCECNPIELCWGRAKDWTRKKCTYSFEGLRKNVPLSFRPEKDRQAVAVVQGYCKKAYTHALVYLNARALGPEGQKMYKKFKSHRRPTPKMWRE